jgi:transposase InsO family protein
VRVGKKRVARLMQALQLQGVSRRGKRRRTTLSDAAAAPAPDLVRRRFVAERPDELWLADVTYLPTYVVQRGQPKWGSLYLTNADRPGQEVEVAPAQTHESLGGNRRTHERSLAQLIDRPHCQYLVCSIEALG